MFRYPVGRILEFEKVAEFLRAVDSWPAALVIDGEAGIGKSTLWSAGLHHARQSGIHVLSARAWETESVPAWSAVADLLGEVPPAVVARLPGVQRLAVTRLLTREHREDTEGPAPAANSQVLAAATLSIIEALERTAPVLVAIDDLQWLDPSSEAVVGFVARRLRRRSALFLTDRSEAQPSAAPIWLHLATADRLQRLELAPLSLGGLHEVMAQHLGRSFPRPTMVRIADVSGGNPLYALELARTLGDRPLRSDSRLPSSLAELVHLRIGALTDQVREVLLVAAAAADPTVEMISAATCSDVGTTVAQLESGEGADVISLVGNRVRFNHPLLARGVYTDAAPTDRRRVHRRLADIVTEPELRARHLALAATSADPVTLTALDEAAASARQRGAPAEAAELLDLAIELGADTAQRRLSAADNHFRAGDAAAALATLDPAIEQLPPGTHRALAHVLRAAVMIHTEGYLPGIEEVRRALDDAAGESVLTALIRTLLAFAQVRVDQFDEATANADAALEEADRLGVDQLTSSVLAVHALTDFLCGRGYDAAAMDRALAMEATDLDTPVTLSASAINAVLLMWTGDVEVAADQLRAVRHRLLDRGADTEMLWVSMNGAMIALLRGRYAEAAADAQETVERAERLGGDHARSIGLTMRGTVAAYTGDQDGARRDLRAAIALARSCRSPHARLAASALGFLEVSVGAYAEALTVLEPLLSEFDSIPGVELPTKSYLPDAVEALVALGRHDQAERLVTALEGAGQQPGRPWQRAIGARCRSLVLAAAGNVAEAEKYAAQAMSYHEALAMPFERARTQLLCAQLQRRRRRKRAAEELFTVARSAFSELGAPLWAQRAGTESAGAAVDPSGERALTRTERRIAELAASGLTNREMAATLYVSPKTVEAHLTHVYRKLGIRSRAELGRLMGRSAQ